MIRTFVSVLLWVNLLWCLSTVAASGEQRHGRGLHPPAADLQLHQRAGLGLPPAQPEERPPAEALRRPQVRRQEDRGGGLRPLHPRADQGARVDQFGQVEGGAADRGGRAPCSVCRALVGPEVTTQGSVQGPGSLGHTVSERPCE